ncbi:3-hydroxyacyl-CoA dehydrogenase family protein [Sphingomonas humi]|uniref:3-hydroxyacyl-CoA dehydrogenase family protein n=1 Tax=Sphingomonas humi TaxID=335630 RepID=A0ABP7RN64_9SPHN
MIGSSFAVVGGGTMGVGIAYVLAQAGGEVLVVEPSDTSAERMNRTVEGAIDSGIKRGKLSPDAAKALRSRITRLIATDDLPIGLELIVESVPERLELKHRVLAACAAREPRLLASNTSSLSIDLLAQAVTQPDRFLGMHFFNPVWSLKLVELITGAATSEPALAHARDIVSRIGHQSLTVRDIPGFATSRLDLIAALEAMRMLESGVASAEDIDRAATIAYRHPVGPLRLSDIVGLDVRLDIARSLQAAHGDRFAPPAILERMVAEGKLGEKSGQGFYSYPSSTTEAA